MLLKKTVSRLLLYTKNKSKLFTDALRPTEKPKSHVARNTSRFWAMMLSPPSKTNLRIYQKSACNLKGIYDEW